MAYVSRPRGFKLLGAKQDVSVSAYLVKADDSAPLGIGDTVKRDVDGAELVDGHLMPVVARAAAGDRLLGVVVSVDPYKGRTEATINLSLKHRPASTKAVVYVCDDQDALYEVQLDAAGTDIAATEVGECFDHITALDCDLVTGFSKLELDQTTHSSSDGQFKMLGIVPRSDNLTFEDNVKVIVRINEHADSAETGI